MIQIPPMYRKRLTGVARVRLSWRKKLIVQVQVACEKFTPWGNSIESSRAANVIHYEWRDATLEDLLNGVHTFEQKS